MLCFTIRDVLWLTVVVGLSAGWALDHRKQSQYVNWLLGRPPIDIGGSDPREAVERLVIANNELRAEIGIYKKLVETHKAESQEIRDAVDPDKRP